MRNDLIVTRVRLHAARETDVSTGLVGFVEFILNGAVRITGVALRRTRTGRYALSFPAPRQRPIFAPIDDESRKSIERQVFAALAIETGR